MKQGQYFPIPETPRDVDDLRRQAAPLDAETMPVWLADGDASLYGCVGAFSVIAIAEDARHAALAEARALELAGLVVDRSPAPRGTWRVYVPTYCQYQRWSIGIYAGPSPLELRPVASAANPVLTRDDVTDAAAVFVADPFMVRHAEAWYMFFEVLNWRENKGEIALATSSDGLRWRYERRVLVEPFHLSYPCVFRCGSEYYLVPEARQSGEVRLYRATAFPTEWTFVTTLLEGPALLDPSLFFFGDRWWMIVGTGDDTLRLFMAPRPEGPWREHPRSPVAAGRAGFTRPAGRVLASDGCLLRFGQNGDPEYGLDVRAFEIVELTPQVYREIPAADAPVLTGSGDGWNARGMHHLDAHRLDDGSYVACVDGWSS